jgi:hypothetical protein
MRTGEEDNNIVIKKRNTVKQYILRITKIERYLGITLN